jgi:hypothetical protein
MTTDTPPRPAVSDYQEGERAAYYFSSTHVDRKRYKLEGDLVSSRECPQQHPIYYAEKLQIKEQESHKKHYRSLNDENRAQSVIERTDYRYEIQDMSTELLC